MTPHTLFNADDRAVSPVSAVVLMVAISVMLAATIGAFVLGVGGQFDDGQPTAQLTTDVDTGADAVTITNTGDDFVSPSEFELVAYADGAAVDRTAVGTDRLAPDESVTVGYSTGGTHAVDELRVVHTSSDSVVVTAALDEPLPEFGGWT